MNNVGWFYATSQVKQAGARGGCDRSSKDVCVDEHLLKQIEKPLLVVCQMEEKLYCCKIVS